MSVTKKYQKNSVRAQNEISILERLQPYEGFPHIKSVITTEDTLEITMDYLGEPIQHQDNKQELRKILVDILKLLKILHGENIIHGDIKPDNVLINAKGAVSIIDFGHSLSNIIIDDTSYLTQNLCYRAPELLGKNTPITHKIDIWSLGCTYYELLTDKILFDVDTEKEFRKMIDTKEHIKLMDFYHLDPIDKNLLHKMLEIDPTKRADLDTLLNQKLI
jgi:serine/threonine protein kinase